jgi:hypothetical protein
MQRNSLSAALSRTFAAPRARAPDPHRRAREQAKPLAAQHGIEIERVDSGFNVWPPKAFAGVDPFDGDHYAQDWGDVLARVKAYADAQ